MREWPTARRTSDIGSGSTINGIIIIISVIIVITDSTTSSNSIRTSSTTNFRILVQ